VNKRDLKREYWAVVADCLKVFHHFSDDQSIEMSGEARVRIESLVKGPYADIFYHSEPFDVACDIAEHVLDISDLRGTYHELLTRHGWPRPAAHEVSVR